MKLFLGSPIGLGVKSEVWIEGNPTRADMRRLIAMLTLSMDLLPEAPTDAAVAKQLQEARPLIYPEEPPPPLHRPKEPPDELQH